MRFDGWNTIEGRHLVFIYATVLLVQGGYFLWVAVEWVKLRSKPAGLQEPGEKKATRTV